MFLNQENLVKEVIQELAFCQEMLKEPLVMEPFFKDFVYRFCWNSNSIEGNTLSLDETCKRKDSRRSSKIQRQKPLYRDYGGGCILSSKISVSAGINGSISGRYYFFRKGKRNTCFGTDSESGRGTHLF